MIKFKNAISLLFVTLLPVIGWSQEIKFKVDADGTYSIIGKSVNITKCYPAINNQSINPLSVKVTTNINQTVIQYKLLNNTIEIALGYHNNAVTINTSIIGKELNVNYIAPIYNAKVEGANRVYKTAECISGDGGVKNWPKINDNYNRCALITGFLPDSGKTLIIASHNLSKFISYTYLHPANTLGNDKLINVYFSTELVYSKTLPTIYITENISAFEGMKNEAQQIALVANVKNNKPQSYHWCSWYYAFYHLTESMITEYLEGFNKLSPKVPIQTFQIDAGFFPHVGDWLEPSHKFPQGIEKSIKEIIDNGYKAGIWIGPYMVGNKSKLYKEHPDWILYKKDGSPLIEMKFYGEERLWGLFDEEVYVLDTSNPEAMEYLRQVFRAYRKMGITFFKTDFMLYGNIASHTVKRYTPGKTAIEYQHDLFDMIRQEIGQESYWLGCIAPYPSMIGYVDGMRIAGDVRPEWAGFKNMFDESIGAFHINNIWWQNDPDAFIIREKFNNITYEETKTIAFWIGMLGGVINTSDLFHSISESRINLFRFLEPTNMKATSSAMPFIDKNQKINLIVRKYNNINSYAALFVNKTDIINTQIYSIMEIVGFEKAYCYNWNDIETSKIGLLNNIEISLKPHESKLIFISENDFNPDKLSIGGKIFK